MRFDVFNKSNSPGIVSNRFTGLFEAAGGDLWAGTEESGVVRYHQGRFTGYGTESGLSFSEVFFMSGDADGNPLIVLGNFQTYRFSDEKFSLVNSEPTSPQDAVLAKPEVLQCYSQAEKKQVNCLGTGQFIRFTAADGLPSLNVINGGREVDGTLWLLTRDAGLIQLKNGKIVKIYTKQDGLPEIPIALVFGKRFKLISKDKQDALWLTDLKTMRNELISRRRAAQSFTAATPAIDRLTATERRVLQMIADYKSSKEIAAELFIHHRTVENHRTNICQKLDLRGHNALLKFALEHKNEL